MTLSAALEHLRGKFVEVATVSNGDCFAWLAVPATTEAGTAAHVDLLVTDLSRVWRVRLDEAALAKYQRTAGLYLTHDVLCSKLATAFIVASLAPPLACTLQLRDKSLPINDDSSGGDGGVDTNSSSASAGGDSSSKKRKTASSSASTPKQASKQAKLDDDDDDVDSDDATPLKTPVASPTTSASRTTPGGAANGESSDSTVVVVDITWPSTLGLSVCGSLHLQRVGGESELALIAALVRALLARNAGAETRERDAAQRERELEQRLAAFDSAAAKTSPKTSSSNGGGGGGGGGGHAVRINGVVRQVQGGRNGASAPAPLVSASNPVNYARKKKGKGFGIKPPTKPQ
jgi:hypothetical protein